MIAIELDHRVDGESAGTRHRDRSRALRAAAGDADAGRAVEAAPHSEDVAALENGLICSRAAQRHVVVVDVSIPSTLYVPAFR